MRNKLITLFIILISLFFLITTINNKKRKTIDWEKTLIYKDKIPYGTFIIFKELNKFKNSDLDLKRIDSYLYDYIKDNELTKNKHKKSIFCINNRFDFFKQDIQSIKEYTNSNGNILISANDFNDEFKDEFSLNINFNNNLNSESKLLLNNDSLNYNKFKTQSFSYFTKIPINAEILGYVYDNKQKKPNFIKIKQKNGNIFIHLEPLIFTNYSILDKKSFFFLSSVFNNFPNEFEFWYDKRIGKETIEYEKGILYFIFKNKSLKIAWLLLLLTGILYMIFKSKREQRFIPTIKKPINKSLEFTKTISYLFQEKGNPENIINKKIDFFLYNIKEKYNLNSISFNDLNVHLIISNNNKISLEEVKKHFENLEILYNKEKSTNQDLISAFKIIEKLK